VTTYAVRLKPFSLKSCRIFKCKIYVRQESQILRNYKSDLSIDEKVMMAIVRAAELFKKESSAIFTNYRLTFSQYNVLRVLDASQKGQNTITNVREIMLVSGSRITGLAKRLEKKGFLKRKNDPGDERIKILEITSKGRQALSNIFKEKEDNMKKYLSDYSNDQKKEVLETLKKILKSRIV
jgi:DNA-binding MarR family transcriptional regulator